MTELRAYKLGVETETDTDRASSVQASAQPYRLRKEALEHPEDGALAQPVAASALHAEGRPFDPDRPHQSLPKPYYSHAGIQIFHGDCRDILPSLPKCDLLLTDPPYGIGEAAGKNSSRGKLAVAQDYGDLPWDNAPPTQADFACLLSLAKNSVIWGGNYFKLPPSSCWLVWDKVNGESDFADCELAWTDRKSAVRMFRWQWAGMLQQDMGRKEKRVHPTQKPLAVMKWCLSLFPDAQSVLDPFCGSGTTLVAAKAMGLSAAGIEAEEKYCEIAAKRLSQEVFDFKETP